MKKLTFVLCLLIVGLVLFLKNNNEKISNNPVIVSYERVPKEDFIKEDIFNPKKLEGNALQDYKNWLQNLEQSNYTFTDFTKLNSANRNFFKNPSTIRANNYSYANGSLNGSWSQKSVTLFDDSGFRADGSVYDAVNEKLYVVSSAGHLYKIDENQPIKWIVKNQQKILLGEDFNGVNLPDNSFRLLHQKSNGGMEFSDDEGITWVDANGAFFQSGYNYKTIVTKTASNRKIVAHGGKFNNGIATNVIYISTDYGLNYTQSNLNFSNANYDVSINKPHNSNSVYCFALRLNDRRLFVYRMLPNETEFSLLFEKTQNMSLISSLHGTETGGRVHFYISSGSSNIYYSSSEGENWTLTTSSNDREIIDIHPTKPNVCFKGFIDLYMSTNYGASFAANNHYLKSHYVWDLRHMKTYDKEDGGNFTFVGMDFGSYYSYDSSLWNSWVSINSGSPTIMAYDAITSEKNNRIYTANQDRGSQGFFDLPDNNGIYTAAREANTDVLRVALSKDEESVWFWYYYGTIGRASVDNGGDYRTVTRKDFYGSWWATIMVPTPDENEDAILVPAGGSKLNKFTYENGTINRTYHSYTFSGEPISFTYSELNTNRWYVGLRDGRLMYSTDGGSSFKEASYSGTLPTEEASLPYRKRRTVVKASRADEKTMFYAGKGSNFLISTDGGETLTKHTNGLNVSRIMDIDSSPDGKFVFAACEFSGAWVFSFEENRWYNMTGDDVPYVQFTDVQYIVSKNVIRFSTYGSGVLDFKLSNSNLSVNQFETTKLKVTAFPNPSSGSFKLSLDNKSSNMSVKVYDIRGVLVYSSNNINNIDLSNKPAGVYIANVKANDKTRSLRLVKK